MANLHFTLLTNIPDQQLSTFRFTERGGSVGRSADCDWPLNDTDRFISNKHVIISFVNDHFLLTDTSSNGTYVNDQLAPLGKGNTHRLQLNDVIKLGKYAIQVSAIDLAPSHRAANIPFQQPPTLTDNNTMSSADADLLDLVSGNVKSPNGRSQQTSSPDWRDTTPPTPLTPQAKPAVSAGHGHLGLFDILSGELPEPQAASSSPFGPEPKPVAVSRPVKPAAADSPFLSNDNTIPDNWDDEDEPQAYFAPESQPTMQESLAEWDDLAPADLPPAPDTQNPEKVAAPAMQASQPPVASVAERETATEPSDDDFFALLYRQLGLPKAYMHAVDKTEFASDLAQVLMTSTQGLMALLAGRSVLKQESRLSMTMIKPQSNNPIKFSLDPTDILEMLLVKKKPGYLSAQAAYAEAMNDLQLHQMAFLSGLQASLEGMLSELSPAHLEKEAEEKGRGLIDFKGYSRKWETFVSKQEKLHKQVRENLNDVLSMHFSAAYENYIKHAKSND